MTDPRPARADAIGSAIVDLLLDRWNPLAAADHLEAATVYQPVVGPLYRLIASGASALRVAVELAEAERRLGRSTPPADLVPVSRALLALDVRL
ncbi:MAG: hypothetical protein ABJC74_16410 [Gemmatimonadota bacterium]